MIRKCKKCGAVENRQPWKQNIMVLGTCNRCTPRSEKTVKIKRVKITKHTIFFQRKV